MANIDVKYEVWKNKLLDLGKRNRLLNYKDTAHSNVKIEYPECSALYNMFVKEENALVFPFEYDEENSEIEYVSNAETNKSTSDLQKALRNLRNKAKTAIATETADILPSFSLSYVGNSIIFTPGGLSMTKGHLPAHTNNFLEIMADGSARMRILLINNDQDDSSVNMMIPATMLRSYKDIYTKIMGDLFPHNIAYAKKYESLTVRQQFQPVLFYDKFVLELNPDLKDDNNRMLEDLENHRKIFGVTTVVTDDRIPKTGLYTIDKRQLELCGREYTAESFIDELFFSRFIALGTISVTENNKKVGMTHT